MDRADMTHPLTPREKVAEIIYRLVGADHRGDLYGVDEAASEITALASGSGDHAELARLADDPAMDFGGFGRSRVSALLAENAALRVQVETEKRLSVENYNRAQSAREEAERNLAEAVGLNERAADLMRQCTDPERFEGASTLNVYANMRAWLSDLPPAPGAEA